MLIYNFQKEFIGIDDKDLKTLGFNNLSALRTEVTDFADLFVKTPGYINNFKHVHWIDFITCSESNEESKVIINVNSKNFRATISITTAYLVDNPSEKAYFINLNNLKELSKRDSTSISNDVVEREAPLTQQEPKEIFNTPQYSESFNEPAELKTTILEDPYETPIEIDLDIETEIKSQTVETFIEKDTTFDIDLDTPLDIQIEPEEEFIPQASPVTTQTSKKSFSNAYVFDPKIAAEELGLPLDLIEEFIGDFIEQAKSFKEKLYEALDEEDINNIKILSHKLKGVAANLRVEDALEALSIINTSSDTNVIEENLDTFYNIISKLSGEEIKAHREVLQEPIIQENIEDLTLDFKDEEDDLYSDPIEISDSDVPEKINIPELADDTFLELETHKEQELEIIEDLVFEEEIQEVKVEYSKTTIANEIGLDIDSFNELFEDYVEEAHSIYKNILDFSQNNDYKNCKQEALKLKGMSDNMRIKSFIPELETIIHSTNKEDIAKAITKIDAAIAQIGV